ncbi:MAG TPA: hypothetical protein PKC23_02950, partial [Candidatus Desulfobacillus sp.]|nr:hypothetical protein [Candidatus Desulfobacillus sp.]
HRNTLPFGKCCTSDLRPRAEKRPFDPPKSKLEQLITVDNAKRALESVTQLGNLFFEKISDEDRFRIFVDGWEARTSFHHEN